MLLFRGSSGLSFVTEVCQPQTAMWLQGYEVSPSARHLGSAMLWYPPEHRDLWEDAAVLLGLYRLQASGNRGAAPKASELVPTFLQAPLGPPPSLTFAMLAIPRVAGLADALV